MLQNTNRSCRLDRRILDPRDPSTPQGLTSWLQPGREWPTDVDEDLSILSGCTSRQHLEAIPRCDDALGFGDEVGLHS
jgi:hypothetical protein